MPQSPIIAEDPSVFLRPGMLVLKVSAFMRYGGLTNITPMSDLISSRGASNFLSAKSLGDSVERMMFSAYAEWQGSDPREVAKRIRSLSIWQAHRHNENSWKHFFLDADSLEKDGVKVLRRCCKALLYFASVHSASTQIAALQEMIDLGMRYHSVRTTFASLGAFSTLRLIASESRKYQYNTTDIKEIETLAEKAQFTLQDNEVYALCKASILRQSSIPEIDNAELVFELGPYLDHPLLSSIALNHIELLGLNYDSTFKRFIDYTMALMMPQCVDFRPISRRPSALSRVCHLIVKYATKSASIATQIQALANIIELIFRCRSARDIFNNITATDLLWVPAVSEANLSSLERRYLERYQELARRAELCLQDHEVFPRSNDYHKELDWVLLELIFSYLQSPKLFFIGARVLVYTWLDILLPTSKDMFTQLVFFLVRYHEQIVGYPDREEAELLITAVLEKMVIMRDSNSRDVFELVTSESYMRLVRLFSSAESESLFPGAFEKAKEFQCSY